MKALLLVLGLLFALPGCMVAKRTTKEGVSWAVSVGLPVPVGVHLHGGYGQYYGYGPYPYYGGHYRYYGTLPPHHPSRYRTQSWW